MNNGGKAEKENTPNEANLQEEEVLRGLGAAGGTTWGARRAGFLQSAAGRPRGAAAEGLGIALVPRHSPRLWPREGLSSESEFLWVPKIA